MKKLLIILSFLLIPLQAFAAAYYVSTSGSGTGVGSEGDPFTMAQANSKSDYVAGDDIYFKRGDTFPGVIFTVGHSGVDTDNYAIIGAYGTGDKPIFDGEYVFPLDRNDGLIESHYQEYILITNISLKDSLGHHMVVDNASYINTVDVDCNKAFNAGIKYYNIDHGVIQGCTVTDTGRKRVEDLGSDYPAAIAVVSYSNNVTVSKNTSYHNHGEGIGFFNYNDTGLVAEDNILYGNKVGIYVGSTKGVIIRRNLVYGTGNATYNLDTNPSDGIGLNNENSNDPYTEDVQIYGNFIAYCYRGIFINSANVAGYVKDVKVYNNGVVFCDINFYSYVGLGSSQYVNNEVKNNYFYGFTNVQAQVPYHNDGIDFDYNLWSSEPVANAKGTNDLSYAAPGLVETTSVWWRDKDGDDLTIQDFALQDGSAADNTGLDLGDTWDDVTDVEQSLSYPTTTTTVSQDTFGWDIGPDALTGGAVASGTISPVGYLPETNIVDGGKTIILTLTNAIWHVDIGTDCSQTTDLLAGITSSGTETYGWTNVVALTYAHVVRTSTTVVTITLPAFATYDISLSELISIIIPATATNAGAAITASGTIYVSFIEADVFRKEILHSSDPTKVVGYSSTGKDINY